MSEQDTEGTYHCPDCGEGFVDYHRCSQGSDRVGSVCSDCSEAVNRETHQLDIEGIAPGRCTSCTFDKMAHP
jgi:hypothetical protein